MRQQRHRLLVTALLLAVSAAVSAERQTPAPQPASPSAEVASGKDSRGEAQALFREVMSPFCPGLTLADCPSPAAFDLRREIDARLARGESREAIVDQLVAEYGPSILADPSATPIGRIAWGVPFALAALVAAGLAFFVRRATQKSRVAAPAPVGSARERTDLGDRVDKELAELD